MTSEEQLAANRANAQLSTDPTSLEGKAKVSHKAIKLVSSAARSSCPPKTSPPIAQSLADTLWRLDGILGLETGIYAIRRRQRAKTGKPEPENRNRKTGTGKPVSENRCRKTSVGKTSVGKTSVRDLDSEYSGCE